MKQFILFFALIVAATTPQANPFAKGDPKIGKSLAAKNCVSCHVSMFGGDGSAMYTRPDRKVKTAPQLLSKISACNVSVGANWFDEDEIHVAAFLNKNYYKFKK